MTQALEHPEQGGPLTPQARFAAYLDSTGMAVKDISKATGFHEKSVSRLRGRTDYLALRNEFQAEALAPLEPGIAKARATMLDLLLTEGVAALRAGLTAQTDEGGPSYLVQARFLELLFNSPVARGMFTTTREDEGGKVQGNAFVQVVFKAAEGDTVVQASSGDIIDGETGEVVID